LWKSWVTHRDLPPSVLEQVTFSHMLPTASTLGAQNLLRALQGRGRIWFAGGYTYPYDSQETALRSALDVAIGLNVTSNRSTALATAGCGC
jgi:predicted NAD/FAD-binding protein